MVLPSSLLGASHERGSEEEQLENLLVVSFGKSLNGISLPL